MRQAAEPGAGRVGGSGGARGILRGGAQSVSRRGSAETGCLGLGVCEQGEHRPAPSLQGSYAFTLSPVTRMRIRISSARQRGRLSVGRELAPDGGSKSTTW